MSDPHVSVVIPTYNRLDRIRRVVEALKFQTVPQDVFEVIVVSDGSSDGTDAFLRSLPSSSNVRALFQSNKGPAAARNNAVAHAIGEIILFIDDDVVPGPGLVAEHVRCHGVASGDVAVIGPLLTPADVVLAPWVAWEQAKLEKQYQAMLNGAWEPTARQFYTGNASLRRRLFLDLGGFEEAFRRAEDVEFAYRLAARGVKFVFTMAAEGTHFAERSFASWLDIASSYGRNDAIFARDRQQTWIYDAVRWEFGMRRMPLRVMTKICLGRPVVSRVCEFGLQLWARVANGLGVAALASVAYSGLFGLRYYQAFLDESGMPDFLDRPVVLPSLANEP